jgi:hypothetical protein
MKMAYIAGPYRAKTSEGIKDNIRKARAVALKYWELGYACICPHTNTGFYETDIAESVLIVGDYEFILRCDVIVMVKDWEGSVGSRAEHEFAQDHGIQVIYE